MSRFRPLRGGNPRVSALAAGLVVLTAACSSPTQPSSGAPTVACSGSISATSPDGKAVAVTYQLPAASGGEAPVTVTCTPSSGSNFAVGSTPVVCLATDARSRQGTCAFSVTVAAPPRLLRDQFLAYGDSLTEGKPGPEPLQEFPGAYPRELETMLRARYTAQVPTVVNQAVGGATAAKLLTGDPTRPDLPGMAGLLGTYRPQVVLLMAGANDILRSDGQAYVQPAGEAVRQMVELAQRSGAVVFLATLPPGRAGALRGKGAPFVPLLNEYLRIVASQTGATLVDVYAAFGGAASTDLVDWDGLHLTKAGYKLVAATFYERILATLEPPGGGA